MTTVCCALLSLVCLDCLLHFLRTNALSLLEEHLSGTLIISSPHVSCAWLRCWLAQLQLAGQTCNAHHTCTIPDPCNTEHFQDNIGHCCAAPFCAVAPKRVTCSSRRACCSFQPCISESERQRSRSAPCEDTRDSPMHRCHILAVVGSRIAERSTRRCLSASKGTASTS